MYHDARNESGWDSNQNSETRSHSNKKDMEELNSAQEINSQSIAGVEEELKKVCSDVKVLTGIVTEAGNVNQPFART